jgi:predicted ester cyclase
MSEEHKALIRRYFEAIDANEAGNWDVLDEFLAPNFVSHGGLPPGIRGDRDGVKKAAEMFRRAAPGRHEIVDQLAEGDRVVSRIRGIGRHMGEEFGVPASGNDLDLEGVVMHRIESGKIVEHWALVDMATFLVQAGAMPPPPAS